MENTTNHLNKTKPTIKTFVTGPTIETCFFEELLRKSLTVDFCHYGLYRWLCSLKQHNNYF